jgi:hypothetical protein
MPNFNYMSLVISVRNVRTSAPHPVSFGEKIEQKELSGACGTHGRGESGIQSFGGESLSERPLRPRHRWKNNNN